MPPLNCLDTWGRETESGVPVEPKRRIFLLFEGENSEFDYFDALINLLNRRKLPKYLAVIPTKREGKDKGASNPKRLLAFAQDIRNAARGDAEAEERVCGEVSYEEGDEIVAIFDADIYKNSPDAYVALLDDFSKEDVATYVTYPSFELFLFLHIENGLDDWVLPHRTEIIENQKMPGSKRRFIERLFSDAVQCNPKKEGACARFANGYARACHEEGRINQETRSAIRVLTSNIGLLIGRLESS
ncbi:RloB family protein [Collinsella sp. An307]|uniref:RloB family protein n=1 Tax=Collinsella sp. An307 TaxID=1965630 RepID=UPI001302948B|nr:RloB family protein [Collinsella sp. An307]